MFPSLRPKNPKYLLLVLAALVWGGSVFVAPEHTHSDGHTHTHSWLYHILDDLFTSNHEDADTLVVNGLVPESSDNRDFFSPALSAIGLPEWAAGLVSAPKCQVADSYRPMRISSLMGMGVCRRGPPMG